MVVRRPRTVGEIHGPRARAHVEFHERWNSPSLTRLEGGLVENAAGASSVRMSPALTVTEAEMAAALDIFPEAIDAVDALTAAIASTPAQPESRR